ncbi:MAG: hypothetical protein HY049_07345 [Acidobacteria bacterium]|nr:hypothetical protein [Acidobacteriota bacterium]
MIRRALRRAGLLVLLSLSVWDASSRIAWFTHRHRGERALAAGDVATAFDEFVKARSWEPGDGPGQVLVARAVEISEANGVTIPALAARGAEERFGVGVAAVTAAVAANPADAWAWFNLAEVYRSHVAGGERLARLRAVVAAAKAGVSHPEKAAPNVRRAPGYEERVMAAACLTASDLDPEFFFYRDALAVLYWRSGLTKEASELVRRSFELTPNAEVHTLLDDAAFAKDVADAILAGIDSGPSVDRETRNARLSARATILERVGRRKEAIEAYRNFATSGEPELTTFGRLKIGQILQDEGKFEESLSPLGDVIASDADGDSGTSALYLMGIAYGRMQDHARAAEFLKRYLARRAGGLEIILDLADELAALGKAPDAERTYVGALKAYPDEPEACARFASFLLHQRRRDEATPYIEKLRALAPDDSRIELLRSEARKE